MNKDLSSTLLQVVPFAIILVMVAVVARRRGLSWTEDLRLVWPRAGTAVLWLVGWVAWIAAEEWVSTRLGLEPPVSKRSLPAVVIAIRVFGMVVLAPLAEELVFRGVLFGRIEKTRLGGKGAVLLTAVFFTVLHVQYSGLELALVGLDALVYGLARLQSRSVLLTVTMHLIGNALAAYQRFGP